MSKAIKKKDLDVDHKIELPNHIQDYFNTLDGNEQAMISKELFDIGKDGKQLDFKSDLTIDEIKDITSLSFNDSYLENVGLEKVFETYYKKYMRLVISKDRKSRGEFVQLNKRESQGDAIDKIGSLGMFGQSKK